MSATLLEWTAFKELFSLIIIIKIIKIKYKLIRELF